MFRHKEEEKKEEMVEKKEEVEKEGEVREEDWEGRRNEKKRLGGLRILVTLQIFKLIH